MLDVAVSQKGYLFMLFSRIGRDGDKNRRECVLVPAGTELFSKSMCHKKHLTCGSREKL